MRLVAVTIVLWSAYCFCILAEPQESLQNRGSSQAVSSVGAPTPILTSLLLAALATANPTLTNTLLLTNPYLATYFVPHLPLRYPIYGYTPINVLQDSSAYGVPFKRDTQP